MQKDSNLARNQAIKKSQASRTPPQTPRGRLAAAIVAFLSLIVLIPLVILSATIIYFQINQLILPGVSVYDLDVGLLSYSDTQAAIDRIWNQDRLIQLSTSSNPRETFVFEPRDLGFWVDPNGTAQAAYDVGRSTQPFADIYAVLHGEQYRISPKIYFDQSTARQTLEALNQSITILPSDASLEYQNGHWVVLPGNSGSTLDVKSTIDGLYQHAFAILLTGTANLVTKSLEPQIADLTPVLEDIQQVVNRKLTLSAYDPIKDESYQWEVSEEFKSSWVEIDKQTYQVQMKINPAQLQNILSLWEQDLGAERAFQNPLDLESIIENWMAGNQSTINIHHNPTTYQVGPGESLWSISLKLGMPMWHILDSNPGLTVNNLEAGMNLNIPSKNILLPLPVIPEKRIVIDISEQSMTVYENGQIRNTHIISTGMSDSPTMAGIFQIQTHEINAYASTWDLYMPHFLGIYEAWPGFMNGIHGLPILSNGQRLWASALGTPASYGCIILNLDAADDLYYWAEDGVIVEIVN
jgi:hypothetical protein